MKKLIEKVIEIKKIQNENKSRIYNDGLYNITIQDILGKFFYNIKTYYGDNHE